MSTFFFVILLAFGIFMLVSDLVKLPSLKASRKVVSAIKKGKKKQQDIDYLITKLSLKISKYIQIEEFKRKKLEASLKSSDMFITPEVFTARVWIKTGVIAFLIIPALYIFPFSAIVFLVLAIAVYFKEKQSPFENIKKKREEIENELTHFVLTIEQELKARRSVLSILRDYRKTAGPALAKEIEITVAEMGTSGAEEQSLLNLEARVGSPLFGQVIQGLLAAVRGDKGEVYFQLLAHDFKNYEFHKLKLLAAKRPAKIRKYSFAMLVLFVLTYLIVICMAIFDSSKELF